MNTAEAVAVIMVLAMTLYACSGLADFGAGLWDLTAGGREGGRRPRALIDAAVTPVWEVNHMWLVFMLILCWTAFGPAFAAIMTTLFVPLTLAAVGIVLRGASFAVRKDAARTGARHLAGWLFGLGSVLTPFCLGLTLGTLMTGRVPLAGTGSAPTAEPDWLTVTAVLVGLLAVATGAFVAAGYLVAEAGRRGLPALAAWFRARARVAGAAGLVLGIAALTALRFDQRRMFDLLVGRGWPLLTIGVLALGATFWLAGRGGGRGRGTRPAAVVGVAALVWAWAVAQYPYLLPFTLTIEQGAGAPATMRWVLVWFGVAVLLVGPALVLVYTLDQRDRLGEDPTTAREEPPLGSGEPAGQVVTDP
ncbi:cytochrome d ubiquinol oxidase subunit II [Actinoplanes sp. NPDC049118]|uniref:cytochrome d ubiquinol oxidase subunit II n=1 Tax=Actinoplanes sp. NPDC049118 TaxID=3155769 RepID=UPI0033DFC655